jgi:hypothetical protein
MASTPPEDAARLSQLHRRSISAQQQVDAARRAALSVEQQWPSGSRDDLEELLRMRRASWRASSRWRDADGVRTAEIVIVDCGEHGYWEVRPPGDASTDLVVLEPREPGEVWDRLHELVPGLVPDATVQRQGLDGRDDARRAEQRRNTQQ